jgi:hypothetical protein
VFQTLILDRTYKGSKVEWDSDECATALTKPQCRKENKAPKKKDAPIMNRFQALAMDGTDDSDDDHDTSVISLQSKLLRSSVPS